MLNPLPDKESYERKLANLIEDGDISDVAGYLQMGRTNLSKMLNPDVENRHNPFWLSMAIGWALDAKYGGPKTDAIIQLSTTARQLWLPSPTIRSKPGQATKKIGDELMDLIEKELAGASADELLKEAHDILGAARAKVDEILARAGKSLAAAG